MLNKIVLSKGIVFKVGAFNVPATLINQLNSKTFVIKEVNGFSIADINELFVKEEVVLFKEIEDYTHYQTELNFGEESI